MALTLRIQFSIILLKHKILVVVLSPTSDVT